METQKGRWSDKEEHIVACALELLCDAGGAGLTMRGIADRAGMRLSNVQYYFKTRDHILSAMVGIYLAECEQALQTLAQSTARTGTRQRVQTLVAEGLQHGVELSDMCRIFRELWAVSSQDEAVHRDLMRYYEQFARGLVQAILQDDPDSDMGKRLQCLLVPFIEGYSITAPAMPLPVQEVTALLTDIVLAEMGDTGSGPLEHIR